MSVEASALLETLKGAGFDFCTGVPCSFLTSFINEVIASDSFTYVGATSEGEACAIAAGAALSGKKPVVLLQNSGLGNAVNPITSLHHPFRLPFLMLVTWRGEPGIGDEPQHEVMGVITHQLLDLLTIRHFPFPADVTSLATTIGLAELSMRESGLPSAVVIRQHDVSGKKGRKESHQPRTGATVQDRRKGGLLPSRYEVLQLIDKLSPNDAAVIATTGKTGRELFTIEDHNRNFYLVGSMGCASAVALGVALGTTRTVITIDGDGAALMKLGNFATISDQAPGNLVHVLLDNGVHDSTGGQATASSTVDFPLIAAGTGYRSVSTCDEADGFRVSFQEAVASNGPHLLHCSIRPGSLAELGRPTIKPSAVASRFQSFLA